jgi:sugar phosphate isomerase/epimerase
MITIASVYVCRLIDSEVVMRFGCCVGPEQIGIVADAGFDFCELPARAVLPLEDDAAALPALRAIAAARIRPESFNVLIPGEIRLCGPTVDLDVLRNYLQRAFGRMVSLGGAVAVLGSGAARRIPEDWPRERALDQLAEALTVAGEAAGRAGIMLALEHLNRNECNVFTSVVECHSFIEERHLTGVQLLVDLYHLEVEHEPVSYVTAAGALIAHVHTAGGGRGAPQTPGYDYAGFVRALHAVGYDARISAECGWEDLATQAPLALAFMRDGWAAQ